MIVSYIPAPLHKEIGLLGSSLAVHSIRKAYDNHVVRESIW